MQISGAEFAAGLRYKEHFLNSQTAQKNGVSLVGTPAYQEGGGLLYPGGASDRIIVRNKARVPQSFTIVLEMKWGFAKNEAVDRRPISTDIAGGGRIILQRLSAGFLLFYVNTTITVNASSAAWQPYWNDDEFNTFIVTSESGFTEVWVNGTSIGTSAVVYNRQPFSDFYLGSESTGANRCLNTTFRRFEIYNRIVNAEEEAVIRQGTLVSDILFDRSLITLPMERDFVVSGVQSTPLEGTHKTLSDYAILGDGATSTTFPSKSVSHKRGYDFDGGDYIEVPDHDDLSFTTGTVDEPFTLGIVCRADSFGSYGILSKASGLTVGEFWVSCVVSGSDLRIYAAVVDNTAGAYIARWGVSPNLLETRTPIVITYDGTGLVSGISIYLDNGVRIDTNNDTSGVFVRIRNTTVPVRIGSGAHNPFIGFIGLPYIKKGVAFSDMRVKALCHQLGNGVIQ